MMPTPEQKRYGPAREAALERLRPNLHRERLGRLGAVVAEDVNTVTVPSLCWEFRVQVEPFAMSLLPGGEEVSIIWQVLVLDYLAAREVVPPRGFISFADLAEARSYQQAFEGRVIQRLSRSVGSDRDTLVSAAQRLGGSPVGRDPVQCIFRFFPLFEFQVVRYEGDDDFPPFCNVLFPDNTLKIFSLEDGIVAAERLVAALEGKTPAAQSKAEAP